MMVHLLNWMTVLVLIQMLLVLAFVRLSREGQLKEELNGSMFM